MKPKPQPARRPTSKSPAVRNHEVRIIGGQFKRSKLPVVDKPGLRPTPDRVRETLFNWLGQDLTAWSCLDAFAGTGALGLEAASRGATQVQLVEADSALAAGLKQCVAQLGATAVQVLRGDGVMALRHAAADSLDLIFLDPPFDSPIYQPALQAAARAIRSSGLIYLESPTPWHDDQLADLGLQVWRYLKAGAVHAHVLQRRTDDVMEQRADMAG
jgi:16S rRNA (guanine966-N2)-methyltransferase